MSESSAASSGGHRAARPSPVLQAVFGLATAAESAEGLRPCRAADANVATVTESSLTEASWRLSLIHIWSRSKPTRRRSTSLPR